MALGASYYPWWRRLISICFSLQGTGREAFPFEGKGEGGELLNGRHSPSPFQSWRHAPHLLPLFPSSLFQGREKGGTGLALGEEHQDSGSPSVACLPAEKALLSSWLPAQAGTVGAGGDTWEGSLSLQINIKIHVSENSAHLLSLISHLTTFLI